MSYLDSDKLCNVCTASVTDAEVQSLPPQDRASIVLKLAELDIQRRQALWTAVQGALALAVPLALFFGLVRRRGT